MFAPCTTISKRGHSTIDINAFWSLFQSVFKTIGKENTCFKTGFLKTCLKYYNMCFIRLTKQVGARQLKPFFVKTDGEFACNRCEYTCDKKMRLRFHIEEVQQGAAGEF